jgi:ATP/maltotriose-dependent transcriptional regulator MalT
MPGVLEALNEGRAAFRSCRWQDAFDALREVDASSPLGPEDLEALGSSAWRLCRLQECLAARERALAAHLQADHPRQAALVALALFFSSFRRGEAAIAAGWLARGERLLETEPEGREHGRFLRARAVLALARGDLDGALESARRAAALGRGYEDRELVVLARYVEGCVLLKQGSVSEGMALLDEAMLAAIQGELPPMVIGEIYCNLIDACYELGDLRRAGEWTEGLRRWSETHQPQSVYPGMCRVRRAGVLHLRGAWSEAEVEARRACGELLEMNPRVAAEGFYEIGEIRERTGDLVGAEEAFRRASELGREPQPGLALVRLAQGNLNAATAAIRGALTQESSNRLGRAKLLPAQVEIAIAADDLETAQTAVDELEEIAGDYGSPALEAAAASARGALQLAQNDATGALRTLRRAWQLWQALDCPFEAASARRLLGLACRKGGDEDGAELALSAALTAFEGLGAAREAASTAKLLRGGRPAGLTEREVEVLRLVAAGKSNRDIADELFISVKTVARHLSNIFFKLGVSSRSAATAFAYTHGIVKQP